MGDRASAVVASRCRGKIRIVVAILGVLAGAPTIADAHPLHTTFVDLSYSPQSHILTATVKVFADDFLKRVTRGTVASRNDEANLQKLVAAYLGSTLGIAAPTGERIPLRFCGWKRSADLIFICLSGPLKTGLAGLKVRDAILADVFSDQVNVLQAEYGGARHSMLFMVGGGVRELPAK